MPLVVLGCIAYAAGLLTGLGGAPFVVGATFASLLVALGVAAWRRDGRAAGAALVALAGVGAAWDARATDRRCRVAMARAAAVEAVLEDDAEPGAAAPAQLRFGACRSRGMLLVRGGRAPAGAIVVARGAVAVGGRGAVVRDAIIEPGVLGEERIVALRARGIATVRRLFGRDAGLPVALLLADTRGIPREVKDDFVASGLVHALSVSGLHVGLVAMAVELLALAARLPRRAAALVALGVVALYVLLLGAPPPALRSALMLAMSSGSRLAQRPTSPWAGVAIGAWGPLLLDPRTVLDLGYQLSVSGVAALGASAALLPRIAWLSELRGIRGRLARELATSTLATGLTAPLVAGEIGQLSLAGPVANIAAAPIIAVLQPALFLAFALAPLRPVAALVADACRPLLAALEAVAAIGAAIPGASISIAPTAAAALLASAASVALLVACVVRHPARPLGLACALLGACAWMPLVPVRGGVELHMLDVGQGDAVLLRTPRGRWVLFDAGGAWRGGDSGRQVVVPYLRRAGGELLAFVLSHPHTDHVGGAATVLRGMGATEYWDAGYVAGAGAYRGSLQAARERGVRWRRVHPGDVLEADGVRVRFLAPDSAWAAALDDPNSASTVALVEYGTVRFLLTGDAEALEERWLLERAAGLRADVLKVAHHGSRTSSTAAFLDAVRPRVALVSVGAGNVYRLPNDDVLDRLAAHGAQVLRTDELGVIVVRSDGRGVEVEANDARWPVPARDGMP
jgi:competence protein ComEC